MSLFQTAAGVAKHLAECLLKAVAYVGRPLKLSAQVASRLALLATFTLGLSFIKLDEYFVAEGLFLLTAVIWFAKTIHWSGLDQRKVLTGILKATSVVCAIAFVLIAHFWTSSKRGTKPLTSLNWPRVRHTQVTNNPQTPVKEQFASSIATQSDQPTTIDNQAPRSGHPQEDSSHPKRRGKQEPAYAPGPEDSTPDETIYESGTTSGTGTPSQAPSSASGPAEQQSPPAKATSESRSAQPITLDPIMVGTDTMSESEAEHIAFGAQYAARQVLSCVATNLPIEGKACASIYGTSVVSVRDEIHNRGIEFAELNDAVRQLESAPSVDALRRSAAVLRAVADKIRAMARSNSEKAVVSNGVTAETKTPTHDPIPDEISIVLPPKIDMRKGRLRSLSRDAGAVSATIDECVAGRGSPWNTEDEIVGRCLGAYVHTGELDSGSVTEEIHAIRYNLGNSGVVIDGLEDVVKRIRRGPSKEELRYMARFMDSLSQELSKRAK
jgi:hypothetical protein